MHKLQQLKQKDWVKKRIFEILHLMKQKIKKIKLLLKTRKMN